jgi:leader peptidase (prepilin peptidase)/N-methyltransferase
MAQPYFDDVPGIKEFILPGSSDPVASLVGAVIGGLVGGGSLWLMGEAWKRLRNIEAMGLGDVKMMFMVGAYLGWRLTILTIFFGALSGSIGGIAITIREGRRDLQRTLPYGVCLGIAAIIALFFGSQIVNWYAGFYR